MAAEYQSFGMRNVVATWEQMNIILRAIEEIHMYYKRAKMPKGILSYIENSVSSLTRFINNPAWDGEYSTNNIHRDDWILTATPVMICSLETHQKSEGDDVPVVATNRLKNCLCEATRAIDAIECKVPAYYSLSHQEVIGIVDIYNSIKKLYGAAPVKNELLIKYVEAELLALQFLLGTLSPAYGLSLKSFREFCGITTVFSHEFKASRTLQDLGHHIITPPLDIKPKQRASNHLIHRLMNQSWRSMYAYWEKSHLSPRLLKVLAFLSRHL